MFYLSWSVNNYKKGNKNEKNFNDYTGNDDFINIITALRFCK